MFMDGSKASLVIRRHVDSLVIRSVSWTRHRLWYRLSRSVPTACLARAAAVLLLTLAALAASVPDAQAQVGGVCSRTPQVQDALVAAAPVTTCSAVTDAHLATITELNLTSASITSLKEGDFAGLSALEFLSLSFNELSSLPAGVFSGLSALEILVMSLNELSSLPAGVFSGLSALEDLDLGYNELSSLPAGVFSGLSALSEVNLGYNELSSLPTGVFSGLSALTYLDLNNNDLSSLPAGVFSGLSALTYLDLTANSVDPLPVTVSLVSAGPGAFKATAHTGAPFHMEVPVSVTNGTIEGRVTTVTIPPGSVESGPLTVTRTPGTTGAVTADIGTLPGLPPNHLGYAHVKSADLPLTVVDPTTTTTGSDLVVGSPSVSDDSPVTGAVFTLSVTVRNGGDGAAAATTLRYYRSADATITTSDTATGTDAVGALSASGTSAESIDLTAPLSAGTYYYGACVDAVADESDTTNNCSTSAQVTVLVETQGCSADAETWRGLQVCDERPRNGYDRDAFGTGYSSLEDEIIAALPPTMKATGQVYTPYSCIAFDITAAGTAATDIEHIVALAETHDSGIADDRRRDIASDLDNLTIADPTVNRSQKSDRDAAEWMPARHGAWFAERVIQVKLEYGLSVDPAERDALEALLSGGGAQLNCVDAVAPTPTMLTLSTASAPAEGGNPVTVTATLDNPAPANGTTVTLTTGGTATLDTDYTLSSTTITIAAGETAGTATITVTDDAEDDDGETIVIDAESTSPALIAEPLTLTIEDNDDPAPTLLTLSAAPAPIEGGNPVTVTATLDNPAPATGLTVTLTTSGTATLDTDYTLSSTTITLAEGETAGTVTITVTDDAEDDDGETIVIDAESTSPALTAEPLTLTIEDNDVTPVPALPLRGVLLLGLLLTLLGAVRIRMRERTDIARGC